MYDLSCITNQELHALYATYFRRSQSPDATETDKKTLNEINQEIEKRNPGFYEDDK